MQTRTTIPFSEVVLACRDSLARIWSLRLAPWLFLLVLVCFVPTQAEGQEAGLRASVHYTKGILFSDKEMWDEGIAEFTKAIELNPSNAFAYNGRGKAYYNKGQYDQAIADYDKAIELKPNGINIIYENRNRAYEAKSGGTASDSWMGKTAAEYFNKVGKEGFNPQPPPASEAKTETKASDRWLSKAYDDDEIYPKVGEAPTPQPSPASTQPWQTSWTAFCSELQRLYKRGASDDEMDALFAGKAVSWEGPTMKIDRAENLVLVALPQCQVIRADNRSASVIDFLPLHFKSSVEIPNDLKEPARVHFSTRLAEPQKFPNGKTAFLTRPVFWATWRKEGEEPVEKIKVNTSDDTKLLDYVKIDDDLADKVIKNYEQDPEGMGKKIDKFFEDHERNPQEQDKQVEDLINELFK